MLRVRREYQSWVANESLEDYALRYASSSYRRWSPGVVANTAIGGISFLALEAIGASITLSYGFANALAAVLVVSLLIFLVSLPIAYWCSVANVDVDLLTRGAGFGYVGSTITSLIYAAFTLVFFAIETSIWAQALQLALGLKLVAGYLICSLVIIPIVFFGVTSINKLQAWTQPVWVVLMLTPFAFILVKDPGLLHAWTTFGNRAGTGGFDLLLFGAASGVLFSLIAQIGEQADYLRFLPRRTPANRRAWWSALLVSGRAGSSSGRSRSVPAACSRCWRCAWAAAPRRRSSRSTCSLMPTGASWTDRCWRWSSQRCLSPSRRSRST
jgi:cytosine/uracil/thiamine/allantoin permease